MSVKSKIIYAVFGILTVGIFSLFPIFESGNALAFKPHHKKPARHAKLYPGKVVVHLPAARVAVRVGGAKYYYHGGVFYRRGTAGFIVVHAPVGAVVVSLPIGYSTIVIDGNAYYSFSGVYYRKGPSGYVVVSPPMSLQPQVSSGSRVVVIAQVLNVRSGPGMHFSIIRTARQGDALTVHGTSPGWLYVSLPGGNYGWVSTTFTAPAEIPASG